MDDNKARLLLQSTAIRTKVLPEVRSVCDQIKPDLDSVRKYTTNIKEWLLPVIDLRDYHVYPTNGITEGLNWWYNRERRTVDMIPGDYQWINRTGSDLLYVSMPSSIDGNWHEIKDDRPLSLDLAYVGSAVPERVSNSNVERAFFSLSKPFGIRNLRTGWYFTREPDQKLEDLIFGAKYYNYHAVAVAEAIIADFAIDYVHKKLHNQQLDICEKLGFKPSSSVWLATSEDEDYAKFKRAGNPARICLSELYNAA